jgi:hypothetical protein
MKLKLNFKYKIQLSYIMVKVRIHTGRGTGTIEVDENPANWTGDEFKAIQRARKELASEVRISQGRGTSSRRLKDTPEPQERKVTGPVVTNRGTKIVQDDEC